MLSRSRAKGISQRKEWSRASTPRPQIKSNFKTSTGFTVMDVTEDKSKSLGKGMLGTQARQEWASGREGSGNADCQQSFVFGREETRGKRHRKP